MSLCLCFEFFSTYDETPTEKCLAYAWVAVKKLCQYMRRMSRLSPPFSFFLLARLSNANNFSSHSSGVSKLFSINAESRRSFQNPRNYINGTIIINDILASILTNKWNNPKNFRRHCGTDSWEKVSYNIWTIKIHVFLRSENFSFHLRILVGYLRKVWSIIEKHP